MLRSAITLGAEVRIEKRPHQQSLTTPQHIHVPLNATPFRRKGFEKPIKVIKKMPKSRMSIQEHGKYTS